MKSKTTTQDLRMHLFDMIERVKSINDPNCDENDKCSLEQAAAICEISEQIIDSYKVEVQALGLISKADNQQTAVKIGHQMGLIDENIKQLN